MRDFDPQAWQDAAWGRFGSALRRGVSKTDAENKWFEDLRAIGDLTKLTGWCRSKGITVVFGKKQGAAYYPDSKEIVMSNRLSPARQAVVLTHECGHHLIGLKEHHERFGMGYPKHDDAVVSRTLLHRVSCVEEELEAWHRGWKLAQRLDLSIERERFDAIRLECIKTYFNWALRPGKAAPE